jgi:hypothetical protein
MAKTMKDISKLVIPWNFVPKQYICHVFDSKGRGWYSLVNRFFDTGLGSLYEDYGLPTFTTNLPTLIPSNLVGPKNMPWRETLTFRPGFEMSQEEINAPTRWELIRQRMTELAQESANKFKDMLKRNGENND